MEQDIKNLTYRQFWWKWTLNCGIGELLSMAAAATIAVSYNYYMGEPKTFGAGVLNVLVMLGAGALEGTILSWFQWSVLRLKFTYLRFSEWFGYTVAVAILGWALGMIPSMVFNQNSTKNITPTINPSVVSGQDSLQIHSLVEPSTTATAMQEPSIWWILLGAAVMGLVLGALFGLFQWLALRRHSSKAVSWILANSLGWGLGMVWIFLGATLPDATTPIPLIVGMGAAGGILGGLSVGFITGWFLLWIPVNE